MTPDNVAVLKEKIRRLEADLLEVKGEVRNQGQEIDDLAKFKETNLLKLDQIQKQLDGIQTTLSRDTGWRGFFLDFIKAAAQIAVLVGAGKWIF